MTMITTMILITTGIHIAMSNGIITLLTAFVEMMEGVGVKAKDEYKEEGKNTILLEREGFISV